MPTRAATGRCPYDLIDYGVFSQIEITTRQTSAKSCNPSVPAIEQDSPRYML